MAKRHLHRFQVCAAQHMVRRHGMPQRMHRRMMDARLGKILRDHVLDGTRRHPGLELRDEEAIVVDPGSNFQIGCHNLARLVVQGDALHLPAFALYTHAAHRLDVAGDALRELNIAEREVGELGEAHARLEEHFNDGSITWVVTACPQ